MAGLVKSIPDHKNGVLVPMPGRTGIALYTKDLAKEIGSQTGLAICDILKSDPHKPLYDRKVKKGIESLRPFNFQATETLPKGKFPIVVDNVLDTGTTAMSAFRTLGNKANLVVLGSTVNYRIYNYPVDIMMINDKRDNVKGLEQLKEELKTAISDVLFVGGYGLYDRGNAHDPRFTHEKTLSGVLPLKVPVSSGEYMERIGFKKYALGQPDVAVLHTDKGAHPIAHVEDVPWSM